MKRPYCNAPRHGTYTAYHKAGCRCDDARDDYNRYRARWSEGPAEDLYVPSLGARMTIQALMALGYTYQQIANAAGLGRNTVWEIANGRNDKVLTETDDKVSAAFGALGYVDEILVELFVKGEGRRTADELNEAEKRDAAKQLLAKGLTASRISVRLHWSFEKAQRVVAAILEDRTVTDPSATERRAA